MHNAPEQETLIKRNKITILRNYNITKNTTYSIVTYEMSSCYIKTVSQRTVLEADRKRTKKAISFSGQKIKENKKDPTFSAENEK